SRTAGQIMKISYQAPVITGQPADQLVNQGQSAAFTVAASGATPFTYQWQHLTGSTWTNVGPNSSTFTIASNTTSDAGSYRVIVSNIFGSATSNSATLTVSVANTAPSITTQPTNQMANVGQAAAFAVVASGTAPFTYQWQHLTGGIWNNIGPN